MDYSKDEQKAMKMVENYFRMIECIKLPKERDFPSQDRNSMLKFLGEKEGESQLIFNLYAWVADYEVNRERMRELSDKKKGLEQNLYNLLGKGKV